MSPVDVCLQLLIIISVTFFIYIWRLFPCILSWFPLFAFYLPDLIICPIFISFTQVLLTGSWLCGLGLYCLLPSVISSLYALMTGAAPVSAFSSCTFPSSHLLFLKITFTDLIIMLQNNGIQTPTYFISIQKKYAILIKSGTKFHHNCSTHYINITKYVKL